ncbi:MAG: type II secretion system F family protein [Planctomycetales bacterium]|nr:type II secretion system F family protein [Planctomycetales bacterium]
MDFESLLPFALFGLFAVGAWWVLSMIAGGSNRATERLEEIRDPYRRRNRDSDKPGGKVPGKSDAVAKVLEKASPTLAKPLQPKSELEANRLKQRLSSAGFRGESAPSIFLGLKIALLLGGLLIGGSSLSVMYGFSQKALVGTVLIAGGFFYLPELAVTFISHQRRQAIFLGLPDALDLLVVCVEAGLGLDQAMRKVSEEMTNSTPVIASEFALANFQLQMGRPRNEVLHELGVRTGVDDVRALTRILIQAEKFGTSIAQALRVQSDAMRTRRSQIAEEKAAKTAVKLIFPLVIFIFPGIFVVLVGPAAITMVRQLFPSMSG